MNEDITNNPSLGQIIREFESLSVEALFLSAHGRRPTVSELADVCIYIENTFPPAEKVINFDDLEEILTKLEEQQYVDDMIADDTSVAPTPVTVKTKPKAEVKKSRSYNRRSKTDINWKTNDAQTFLDFVIDGKIHVLTYKEVTDMLPNFPKITKEAFSNYVRAVARKRGYKTCSVRHNKRLGEVTIQASNNTRPFGFNPAN